MRGLRVGVLEEVKRDVLVRNANGDLVHPVPREVPLGLPRERHLCLSEFHPLVPEFQQGVVRQGVAHNVDGDDEATASALQGRGLRRALGVRPPLWGHDQHVLLGLHGRRGVVQLLGRQLERQSAALGLHRGAHQVGLLLLLLSASSISPQPVALLFHGLQRLPRLVQLPLCLLLADSGLPELLPDLLRDLLGQAVQVRPPDGALAPGRHHGLLLLLCCCRRLLLLPQPAHQALRQLAQVHGRHLLRLGRPL